MLVSMSCLFYAPSLWESLADKNTSGQLLPQLASSPQAYSDDDSKILRF
jgi:hypothetical protein